MGLQPAPVGQIDRMRRDVVDRGAAVVIRQRNGIHVARKLPRGQSGETFVEGRIPPRRRGRICQYVLLVACGIG